MYNEDYKNVPPEEYIKQQPLERQEALKSLRQTVLDHLPQGFKEVMEYGMVCYFI